MKKATSKCALVPSPKRHVDAEKAARVAGKARENGEKAGTRARAEKREERRERVREDVVASWRMARADIVDASNSKTGPDSDRSLAFGRPYPIHPRKLIYFCNAVRHC